MKKLSVEKIETLNAKIQVLKVTDQKAIKGGGWGVEEEHIL